MTFCGKYSISSPWLQGILCFHFKCLSRFPQACDYRSHAFCLSSSSQRFLCLIKICLYCSDDISTCIVVSYFWIRFQDFLTLSIRVCIPNTFGHSTATLWTQPLHCGCRLCGSLELRVRASECSELWILSSPMCLRVCTKLGVNFSYMLIGEGTNSFENQLFWSLSDKRSLQQVVRFVIFEGLDICSFSPAMWQ